ncbi:ADP-ribosylation factor-like protein 5B [Trichinella pseudospiralis]|uniref:ADP-ribosylation factor-like protein 5B n=1 Tax=Trichinella pseudospiralis TaxID=6337 RepID=A0A0V1JG67_TRIPS|nr:ADP-ribosylation factor-like protein 5B [Trichinella pseudospiralis]
MGLLVTKLWRWLFNNQEHKVIIVGLDNAGKTTILYHFLMDEVVHTSPTIGSNVEEVVWKNIHFLMWDIGGQDSLRASWNTYYTNTEVIAIVLIHHCSLYCVLFYMQIMFIIMLNEN